MNTAASVSARHGNLPANPMTGNVIEISDGDNSVNGLDDAIVTLDPSDDEQRGRPSAGSKAEQVQHDAFDNDYLYNASPRTASIRVHKSTMDAARTVPDAPSFQREWDGDYIRDDAFDDPELAKMMMEEISGQSRVRPPPQDLIVLPGSGFDQSNQIEGNPVELPMDENGVESRINVVVTLLSVFPDICQNYISDLYDKVSPSSGQLIVHILDQTEKGKAYPKSKDKHKNLKRKRDIDEDETATLRYGAADRAPVFGLTRSIT
jgi:hypothetical protein